MESTTANKLMKTPICKIIFEEMRYDYVLFSGALPYITKLFSIDLMFVYSYNFWNIVRVVTYFDVGMLEAPRTDEIAMVWPKSYYILVELNLLNRYNATTCTLQPA